MAYRFATRHDRLRTRMREVNFRSVVYQRGEVELPWDATVYELGPDALARMGLSLDAERRDYIGDYSEEFRQAFGEPRQGDRIMDGDLVCVLAPLDRDMVFRWTNHQRNELRAHTVVTQDEPDE